MSQAKVEIEARILEKLSGRINLIQNDSEKKRIVSDVISELYGHTSLETFMQSQVLSELSDENERTRFIDDFFKYGLIDHLLHDPETEDIIINSLNPIYIHHAQKGLIQTDLRFQSEKDLDVFIKKLLIFSGRMSLKKINNFELSNIQGRVNIALSPFGPQITITKIRENPMSIIDLIRAGTMTTDMAALLWLYVEGLSIRPANLMIVGAPGAGKTTLLNALIGFIPENERAVLIEDTLELNTLTNPGWSRLECDDESTLSILVKNSLRMRPDRVIVGEVRGEEAQDLMTAMNIGKYCMGTIHASAPREAIIRLQSEPMNIPETLVNLIDVFVIMVKFQVRNEVFRVVSEIAETAGMEQKKVLLSNLWKHDYEKRQFVEQSPTSVFRDKLSRSCGVKAVDLIRELRARAEVLQVMLSRNLHESNATVEFFRAYSRNADQAVASLGLNRQELLESIEI